MQAFIRTSGAAVPMLEDDINTDEIAPIQLNRSLQPDYRRMLFMRSRWDGDGTPIPDHVMNRSEYGDPAILVTGANFGCGSSREAAVWAIMANGITCIVSPGLADQFRENCLQNGVLPIALDQPTFDDFARRVVVARGAPFTADLETQTLSGPGGDLIAFEFSPAERLVLLEGLDDIGLTAKHAQELADWEKRTRVDTPWCQTAADQRIASKTT